MIRLYKMELYKLCKNRAFIGAGIVAIGIWLLFFWFVEVGDEIATVDGVFYQGYEAVQKNREITEEFEGIVTDEKLEQIIQRYGFPKVVKEDYPGFRDANYLTSFVVEYFTDGYMMDWNDYRIATRIYPIEETEVGKLGEEIFIYYTKGWKVLLEMLQMGMLLGSIIILVCVSVVFSQESQTGMLSLLFTTKMGKREDITAKILASFTVTIGIYGVVSVLAYVLCYLIFGLDGVQSPYWLAMDELFGFGIPMGTAAWIVLGASLLALLCLCAVTLCVSAHFRNTFHSVVVAAACWGAPVLLRMIFGGIAYIFVCGTPVFLIMYRTTMERVYCTTLGNRIAVANVYAMGIIVVLAVTVLTACVINAYSAYTKC